MNKFAIIGILIIAIIIIGIIIVTSIIGILFICRSHVPIRDMHNDDAAINIHYKTIVVEIIDVEKFHWYAAGPKRKINLTVYSKDYGLIESFEFRDLNSYNKYKKGDVIEATLYSWIREDNREVIKREIHSLN